MKPLSIVSVLCALFTLPGCSFVGAGDDANDVTDVPSLSALRAAPEVVSVDGKSLVLAPYLYRDFMPIAPPDGKPLIAVFHVVTADSSTFPSGVTSDAGFVLNGGDVWAAEYTGEEQPEEPYQLVEVAREGPKWGPDVRVDVVVRLRGSDGETHLLRAGNVFIDRTD